MKRHFFRKFTAVFLLLAVCMASGVCSAEHFAMKSKNCGPLKEMTGTVCVWNVFVSTPKYPWTDHHKEIVNKVTNTSLICMIEEAKRYGTELNMVWGNFDCSIPFEYSSDRKWYNYLLENFYHQSSIADYYSACAKTMNADSTPVIFWFEHFDVSHAMVSSTDYPGWNEEYCVIFYDTDEKMHDNYLTHELLHLYGAIDLYDYHGEGIQKISSKYFPDSCMLTVSRKVDSLNAYLVGWTKTLDSKAKKFLQETDGKR